MNGDKVCLITGINGQDGSYLAELLLDNGYKVFGIQRRTSTITTERIDHLLEPGHIETFYADLSDVSSLIRVLHRVRPTEVYNMASMSHVRISFDIPEYTGDVTALGPLRLLEVIRSMGLSKTTRFYQASSSEMFGSTPPPQNESSPMIPQSPYGAAKLYAYNMVKVYRTGYGMFAANGILFNHESERRGENFVTKKIVRAAVKIKKGTQRKIHLGNLAAQRDWGHASDYMRAVHMILTHNKPDDFVVSTGEVHSVREFAEHVFKAVGLKFYDYLVNDDQFRRPNEVPALCGDSTKARTVLGWKPQIGFHELVQKMIDEAMYQEEHGIRSTGSRSTVSVHRAH